MFLTKGVRILSSSETTRTDGRAGPAMCGIAVMAKASKPGRTKTRLSPPLSPAEAAQFNTAFLSDIAENVLGARQAASIAGYMAFGPPGESAFFDFLPSAIEIFEAWRPNFGDCLSETIQTLFARGHQAACVLNADSPTLPPAFLVEAAQILAMDGDRAVLGPSSDGGYYLLGLKRHHMRLFQDITWSTGSVTAQTIERAAEIGLPVHMLPMWYDVDDQQSLACLRDELFGGKPFGASAVARPEARHSRKLMEKLSREARLFERLDASPGPAQSGPGPAAPFQAAANATGGHALAGGVRQSAL